MSEMRQVTLSARNSKMIKERVREINSTDLVKLDRRERVTFKSEVNRIVRLYFQKP